MGWKQNVILRCAANLCLPTLESVGSFGVEYVQRVWKFLA